jgi:hypothetical protein
MTYETMKQTLLDQAGDDGLDLQKVGLEIPKQRTLTR